jgi:hypothetical protein
MPRISSLLRSDAAFTQEPLGHGGRMNNSIPNTRSIVKGDYQDLTEDFLGPAWSGPRFHV